MFSSGLRTDSDSVVSSENIDGGRTDAPRSCTAESGARAADGGAEEVHARDPDVLGERVVVPPDEPDELVDVVDDGAGGSALLNLNFHVAGRDERHSEVGRGEERRGQSSFLLRGLLANAHEIYNPCH